MIFRFTILLLLCMLTFSVQGKDYPGELKLVGDNPTLLIDGKPVYPSALRWACGFDSDKDFYSNPGVVEEFSKAGVKIVFLWTELCWKGKDKYYYGGIDKAFRKALATKDVYIIPSIDLGRKNSWWGTQNPNERYMRMKNGKLTPRGGYATASLWSDKFKEEATEALKRYIKHVEEQGWAPRVLGYQIIWGRAGEWMVWERLSDLNPLALKKFRDYLRTKYSNDVDKLRRSWQDKTVDFDNAVPDNKVFRWDSQYGYIIDPALSSRIPDYTDFTRNTITDLILYYAKVIKDATGGKALVGAYSSPGYPWQQFNRIAKSDYLDFGVSSSFYYNRRINGVSMSQAVSQEVFRKSGKLYWHDADSRTYLWPDERHGVCNDVYESIMVDRREFGGAFVKGMGITWFMLHRGHNVFANQAILNDIGKIQSLAGAALATNSDFSSNAEIAIVYDEEYAFRCPNRSSAPLFVNYLKIGAPVDCYTLNRLDILPKNKYKLIVFLACGYISAKEREQIKNLQSDGRTLLFMYSNGIAWNGKFDCNAAKELSGFSYTFDKGAEQQINTVYTWRKKFPKNLPMLGQLSPPSGARRLCVIPKPGDIVIAKSARDGKATFVYHKYKNWTSIQFPGFQTYPGVLRQLAMMAGVKICYPYSDSTFNSCKDFVVLTGGVGGERTVNLDSAQSIYDVFADKIIDGEKGKFSLNFLPYETKILFVGDKTKINKFRTEYLTRVKKLSSQK